MWEGFPGVSISAWSTTLERVFPWFFSFRNQSNRDPSSSSPCLHAGEGGFLAIYQQHCPVGLSANEGNGLYLHCPFDNRIMPLTACGYCVLEIWPVRLKSWVFLVFKFLNFQFKF